MLLAATGFGPDAMRIIMAPQSWLVGAATVGLEIFYYLTLTHLTPTTGSLLVRIAIPVGDGDRLAAVRAPSFAVGNGWRLDHPGRRRAAGSHRARRAPDRGVLGRRRRGAHLHPAQLLVRVPSLEPARPDGDGEAARHRAGGSRHLHRGADAGRHRQRRCCHRPAAAAADHPHARADAACADHPARHAGRQRRHHLDRGVQLLRRWSRSAPRT